MISAARHRQRRRSTSIAESATITTSGPIRRDIESWKIGIRPHIAIAGHVGIDQARIPGRDIFVRQLQPLACGEWSVYDQDIGPT